MNYCPNCGHQLTQYTYNPWPLPNTIPQPKYWLGPNTLPVTLSGGTGIANLKQGQNNGTQASTKDRT